jgi:uncharacterized protein
MIKIWMLGAVVAVSVAGAQAQTKKELVSKLLALQQQGVESIGKSIAGRTAQQVLGVAGQAMQRVPQDKQEAVGKEVQADIKKFHDDIEPLLRKKATEMSPAVLGAAYEEKYSEDELKQVIAWLESPVSKKFVQSEAELAQSLAKKLVDDTRPTIEPKMKTLEASLAKRMGLTPAPAPAASGPAPATKKK